MVKSGGEGAQKSLVQTPIENKLSGYCASETFTVYPKISVENEPMFLVGGGGDHSKSEVQPPI